MCKMHAIAVAFLTLAACDKKSDNAQPVEARDVPATATATASAAATATPTATASATTTAIASAKATTSASAKTAASAPAAPLKPSSAHLTGKNFAIDVAAPGCRTDTPCAMTIKLNATGDYHINNEYPYKLVPTGGFAPDGQEFRKDAEKTGTLTVRFTPKAPGDVTASGTFKMSVCSAENCQIEQQPVSLVVAVQ